MVPTPVVVYLRLFTVISDIARCFVIRIRILVQLCADDIGLVFSVFI